MSIICIIVIDNSELLSGGAQEVHCQVIGWRVVVSNRPKPAYAGCCCRLKAPTEAKERGERVMSDLQIPTTHSPPTSSGGGIGIKPEHSHYYSHLVSLLLPTRRPILYYSQLVGRRLDHMACRVLPLYRPSVCL